MKQQIKKDTDMPVILNTIKKNLQSKLFEIVTLLGYSKSDLSKIFSIERSSVYNHNKGFNNQVFLLYLTIIDQTLLYSPEKYPEICSLLGVSPTPMIETISNMLKPLRIKDTDRIKFSFSEFYLLIKSQNFQETSRVGQCNGNCSPFSLLVSLAQENTLLYEEADIKALYQYPNKALLYFLKQAFGTKFIIDKKTSEKIIFAKENKNSEIIANLRLPLIEFDTYRIAEVYDEEKLKKHISILSINTDALDTLYDYKLSLNKTKPTYTEYIVSGITLEELSSIAFERKIENFSETEKKFARNADLFWFDDNGNIKNFHYFNNTTSIANDTDCDWLSDLKL